MENEYITPPQEEVDRINQEAIDYEHEAFTEIIGSVDNDKELVARLRIELRKLYKNKETALYFAKKQIKK